MTSVRPARTRPRTRLAAGVASAFLLLAVAPIVTSAPAVAATSSGSTATATWQRWLPLANGLDENGAPSGAYDQGSTPTVTVDQTQDLVDQVVHVSWANFTPSTNDVTYSSEPTSPAPFDNSFGDSADNMYSVAVVECRGTDPTKPPTQKGSTCYNGYANTASTDSGHGQGNIVQVNTAPDGTGSADFHVENAPSNDLLGCSSTQACSLVVVPNNGGVQSADSATGPHCDDHSSDELVPPDYQNEKYASNKYQFGTCAWADRIVFPLHFARIAQDCPNVPAQFTAVGSPMFDRGLSQLQAGWCTGPDKLSFDYNSTSNEYLARQLFGSARGALTASTDVALVSRPAGPGTVGDRKFTYAPLVNNAIAIPYYIDNAVTGQPITDIRLDARLVAKLLTQSYQPLNFNCDTQKNRSRPGFACAPAVNGNPQTILDDPEFAKLNMGPGHPDHPDRSYFPADDATGSFFPTVVSGDSDATYELTRWIESDPDARAFLQGKTDPWGMHVNSNYLPDGNDGGASYPTSQFQPLDPGWTYAKGDTSGNASLAGFQVTWNPATGWDRVASTLVGNGTTAATQYGTCPLPSGETSDCFRKNTPFNHPALPSEFIGSRDLWAVTDNSAAASYEFPTAQLVNAHGRAVAPTVATMSAAVDAMSTNPDGITQYVNHRAEAADGYPLTVTDYAMVPTCGLSRAKASAVSSFLTHIADSQIYGVQPGTIAPGLLALTDTQLRQVRTAAGEVSSESCTAPPPDRSVDGKHQHRTRPQRGGTGGGASNGSGGTTPTTTGGGAGGDTGGGHTTGGGTNNGGGTTTATPTPGTVSANPPSHDVGIKPSGESTSLGWTLPALLLVGLALLVVGPVTWFLTATPAGVAAARRMRLRR